MQGRNIERSLEGLKGSLNNVQIVSWSIFKTFPHFGCTVTVRYKKVFQGEKRKAMWKHLQIEETWGKSKNPWFTNWGYTSQFLQIANFSFHQSFEASPSRTRQWRNLVQCTFLFFFLYLSAPLDYKQWLSGWKQISKNVKKKKKTSVPRVFLPCWPSLPPLNSPKHKRQVGNLSKKLHKGSSHFPCCQKAVKKKKKSGNYQDMNTWKCSAGHRDRLAEMPLLVVTSAGGYVYQQHQQHIRNGQIFT